MAGEGWIQSHVQDIGCRTHEALSTKKQSKEQPGVLEDSSTESSADRAGSPARFAQSVCIPRKKKKKKKGCMGKSDGWGGGLAGVTCQGTK